VWNKETWRKGKKVCSHVKCYIVCYWQSYLLSIRKLSGLILVSNLSYQGDYFFFSTKETDGVRIPEVLVPFMGGLTFLPFVRESKPIDNKPSAAAKAGEKGESVKKEVVAKDVKPKEKSLPNPTIEKASLPIPAKVSPEKKPAHVLKTEKVKKDNSKVKLFLI
jgi:hypothetical protein